MNSKIVKAILYSLVWCIFIFLGIILIFPLKGLHGNLGLGIGYVLGGSFGIGITLYLTLRKQK